MVFSFTQVAYALISCLSPGPKTPVQESGAEVGVTPLYCLSTHSIPARMEVLVLKGRMFSLKRDRSGQEIRRSECHLAFWRVLKPLNQDTKQEETLLTGVRENWVAASKGSEIQGGSSGHLLALLSLNP